MTSPISDGAHELHADPAAADRRRKLARKWAYLISLTAYVPMSHVEIERELLELVNRVFDATASDPVPTDRVAEVGASLVRLHCVGEASLQHTVDTLAGALLAEPPLRRFDRLPERVVHVLGALASGYADAVRSSIMEQQSSLQRTLREAFRESLRSHRAGETLLNDVLAYSETGIAITDLDGWFVRANAVFDRTFARSSADSQIPLFELVAPDDRATLRDAYRNLRDGTTGRLALRQKLRRHDGEAIWVSVTASLLRDTDGQPNGYLTMVADDTELSLLRTQLNHQLLHDVLTGLPNRQYFTTRLEHTMHAAEPTTLYQLDLDSFALVAEGLGRQASDCLLRTVATRLRDIVDNREAMVARFEGGTFGLLVENVPDTATMVERITEVLAKPVRIGNHQVAATACIGVVPVPAAGTDPAKLLHAADLALRQAKSKGRGRWTLSDPDRDARDRETLRLAATMPGAWHDGQLRIGYQPVVQLAGEQVLGVRALLCWDHPRLGTLPHHRCVELAERTGLLAPLENWLLREAAKRMARSGDLLCADLTASQPTAPDLIGSIRHLLDDTGLPPARLELGLPAPRTEAATDNLRHLAHSGIQIAIHDFGGTPEDLACLEDQPVSTVRIAAGLVHRGAARLGPGPLVTKAAEDVITLAHLAAASVTVDDIRTRDEATWWHKAGADAATGPLFAQLP